MLTEHTDFAVMILFFIIYGVTGAVPLSFSTRSRVAMYFIYPAAFPDLMYEHF